MAVRGKVLIVEDDRAICSFMRRVLEANGYESIIVGTGREALSMLTSHCPDVVILDLGLPDMDGMDVLTQLRAWSLMPVVVVSARTDEREKVRALDAGADDYITKPFEMMELLARVESVLRRTGRKNSVLKFQNLTIDEDQRQVYGPAGVIELTPKEFDLFVFLIRNRNIALYREEILEKVWHDDYEGTTRTVDMHVASLRKKLGLSKQIVSVYKIGYRLEDRL